MCSSSSWAPDKQDASVVTGSTVVPVHHGSGHSPECRMCSSWGLHWPWRAYLSVRHRMQAEQCENGHRADQDSARLSVVAQTLNSRSCFMLLLLSLSLLSLRLQHTHHTLHSLLAASWQTFMSSGSSLWSWMTEVMQNCVFLTVLSQLHERSLVYETELLKTRFIL